MLKNQKNGTGSESLSPKKVMFFIDYTAVLLYLNCQYYSDL